VRIGQVRTGQAPIFLDGTDRIPIAQVSTDPAWIVLEFNPERTFPVPAAATGNCPVSGQVVTIAGKRVR